MREDRERFLRPAIQCESELRADRRHWRWGRPDAENLWQELYTPSPPELGNHAAIVVRSIRSRALLADMHIGGPFDLRDAGRFAAALRTLETRLDETAPAVLHIAEGP